MRFAFAMIFLFASPVYAEKRVGDWFVSIKSEPWAASINDSGNIFGQYCFPENDSCIWLLAIDTSCTKGDEYPVLVNSVTAAVHINVICGDKIETGLYRYVFNDFDKVSKLVQKGTIIGFAVPLDSGRFQVVRFSLSGSSKAISTMRDAASGKAQPAKGTKDVLM